MSKASSIFNKLAQEHRSHSYVDKDIKNQSEKSDWKTKKSVDGPITISTGWNDEGFRSDTLKTNIGPGTDHYLINHTKPIGDHWIDDTGVKNKKGDWPGANVEQYLTTDKGTLSKNVKQYIGSGTENKKMVVSPEEIDKAHEEIEEANKKNKALKKEGEYNMSKADNVMEKVGQLKALKAGLKWIDKGIQTIGRKVLGKVKSTKSGKKVLKNKKWADARKKKTKRIVGGTVAAGGAYAGKKIVD